MQWWVPVLSIIQTVSMGLLAMPQLPNWAKLLIGSLGAAAHYAVAAKGNPMASKPESQQ